MTPDHLTPAKLKAVPAIFPVDLTHKELMQRLVGGIELGNGVVSGGIKGYNESMRREGTPANAMPLMALQQFLAKSGYDYKLAKHVYPE